MFGLLAPFQTVIVCTEIKHRQQQDRKTILETLSLPVAKILSPIARQAQLRYNGADVEHTGADLEHTGADLEHTGADALHEGLGAVTSETSGHFQKLWKVR